MPPLTQEEKRSVLVRIVTHLDRAKHGAEIADAKSLVRLVEMAIEEARTHLFKRADRSTRVPSVRP